MSCGKREVTTDREIAICGQPFYTSVHECDKCKIKRLEAVIAQRNIVDVVNNACQSANLLSEELAAAMERIADLIVERDAARAVIAELRIDLEIYRKGAM